MDDLALRLSSIEDMSRLTHYPHALESVKLAMEMTCYHHRQAIIALNIRYRDAVERMRGILREEGYSITCGGDNYLGNWVAHGNKPKWTLLLTPLGSEEEDDDDEGENNRPQSPREETQDQGEPILWNMDHRGPMTTKIL